jgi:hypothetical protein
MKLRCGGLDVQYVHKEPVMKSWSITEARARISEMFDAALTEGPQRVERRDREGVVVVSEEVWTRLTLEYPSFADIVLEAPVDDIDLPARRPARVFVADPDG